MWYFLAKEGHCDLVFFWSGKQHEVMECQKSGAYAKTDMRLISRTDYAVLFFCKSR